MVRRSAVLYHRRAPIRSGGRKLARVGGGIQRSFCVFLADEVWHLNSAASAWVWRGVLLALALTLTACGTVPQRPARLSNSSYDCMKAVLDQKLPAGLPDDRAHCVASGLIARYCSVTEAYLAGASKELKDLVGPGDAEWRDWRADRAGIACARQAENDEALVGCCEP